MTKTYFRRADGVMLLYDVTSERSFTSVRHWVQCIDVSYSMINIKILKYYTPFVGRVREENSNHSVWK